MAALVESGRCVSEFIPRIFTDERIAESLAVIIVPHNIYSFRAGAIIFLYSRGRIKGMVRT